MKDLTQLQALPGWERFEQYYCNNYKMNGGLLSNEFFSKPIRHLPESFLLAALSDWLDSLGVYLRIIYHGGSMRWYCLLEGEKLLGSFYPTRNEALKAGILKAFTLLPN